MRSGVIIVTHGGHGEEMLAAAGAIVGELPLVAVVSVAMSDGPDSVRAKVHTAVSGVDEGNGVLFLVDLHGSTPYRVCDAVASANIRAETLSGLNMAMLLKLASCSREEGPHALAELLKETGRRSIQVGCDLPGHPPRPEAEKR